MTDTIIRAPRFEFGTAVTQLFNLPGGKSYLFRVIGFGTLLLVTVMIVLGVPILKSYVSLFSSLATVDTTGLTDEEELAAVMGAIGPMFASMGLFTLLYVFQYCVFVSIETALYRNIIRGEDKGFFPLRFGGDEFKVLITRIVVAIILYAALMAVYFGAAIIGFILLGIGGATGSNAILVVMGGLGVLLFLAVIGIMIYGSIRLAPSAAFSVRDDDFTPVGSWGPMKTYFWPTFGAVLVVGFIGYFVASIFSVVMFGILMSASGIIPILMELDIESNDVPDFSPVIEIVSSAGFIVPVLIVMMLATFFSFLFIGSIWSIWGYVAKLTDPKNIADEYV